MRRKNFWTDRLIRHRPAGDYSSHSAIEIKAASDPAGGAGTTIRHRVVQ
jgi:hypothetical protein